MRQLEKDSCAPFCFEYAIPRSTLNIMPTEKHSRIKDLSQARATFAFAEVEKANAHLNDKAKEFKSHVKDVPMMIRTNGLAAAYAFVFSKAEEKAGKKNDYKLIEEISLKWLVQQEVLQVQAGSDFYKTLTHLEREPYRRAVRELLALFTWLKRFADGMINS